MHDRCSIYPNFHCKGTLAYSIRLRIRSNVFNLKLSVVVIKIMMHCKKLNLTFQVILTNAMQQCYPKIYYDVVTSQHAHN